MNGISSTTFGCSQSCCSVSFFSSQNAVQHRFPWPATEKCFSYDYLLESGDIFQTFDIFFRCFNYLNRVNRRAMILGPISYLDCFVFLTLLAPQLIAQAGLFTGAYYSVRSLPFLS